MQLSIKNVSKTYSNNVEALKDVTLEVNVNSHNDDIKNVLSYEKIIQIINPSKKTLT